FCFVSRTRHTSCYRDWSSDVCSSDLNGTVTGPLDDPLFAGQVSIANATIEGHFFDRFNGDVEAASRHGVRFTRLLVARAATELEIGRASCRDRGERRGDARA